MRKVGSFLLLMLVIIPTWAESEVGKHVAGNMNAASMILSLFFVLGMIVVSAYVLKKFNVNSTQRDGLKVITTLPLSTKEKLIVVEVGKKQLLLGVTANQINLLETLDEPIEVSPPVNQKMALSLQNFLQKSSVKK